MTRSWKTFSLQALLAAALATAPAAAGDGDSGEKPPDLKDIAKRLQTIEEGMKAVLEKADTITNEALKLQALKGRISRLEEQMARVQTTLDALKKNGPPQERVAAYPPESLEELRALLTRIEGLLQAMAPAGRVAGFGPAGQTGRIMLSNRYPEEMLFIVNGTSYRVAPGSTRVLDPQPAGTITYEVLSPTWGLLRRRTTTLAANEPFRINVD